MDKSTLYLVLAALGVYFAWRTFRINKKAVETLTYTQSPVIERKIIKIKLADDNRQAARSSKFVCCG